MNSTSRIAGRGYGAIVGLVSVGLALGSAQLAAGLIHPQASPLITVGQAAIDATPAWLKEFAISNFGTNDKLVLLSGIGVALALMAAILGAFSVRDRLVGVVGIAALTVIGIVTALTRPAPRPADLFPSMVGGIVGVFTMTLLWGRLEPAISTEDETDLVDGYPEGFDRRRFLRASAWGAAAAVMSGVGGRFIASRSAASASRSSVDIPPPVSPAISPAAGTDMQVGGLSPFITPTSSFYRVDTSLLAPSLTAEDWKLNLHGMVKNPMQITYRDLLGRGLVERDITLCCVSNPVGGPYISNARWTGVLLKPILEEAGVSADSTQIVTTSVDGFTIGTPTDAVMDGRDALLAVTMNGEPLPIGHGFPVRMIVPGLYGFVSAMKWITDMELTTFEAYDAYWIRRGWAQQAPIITESRIDTPRTAAKVRAGEVPVAGVAWAQHKGVAAVEVQIDDGAWQPAELSAQDTIDTWRQWLYRWDATPGSHTVKVRATDQTGYTQTSVEAPPAPRGATGWHTISVQVA